jgi:hypothetical protein
MNEVFMKNKSVTVFMLIVLFSTLGQAGNGVERFEMDPSIAESMSERAQTKLLHFVSEKCRPILLSTKKVNTRLVDLTTNRVDQGIIDYTYTVNVQFQRLGQKKSESAQITLTDYAGTNPGVEWVHIEKVEMTNNQICEFN